MWNHDQYITIESSVFPGCFSFGNNMSTNSQLERTPPGFPTEQCGYARHNLGIQ